MFPEAFQDLPKTRKEALALGSIYFYSGPCTQGHISPRLTKANYCKECQREQYTQWRTNNLDKHRARQAARRAQKQNANPPWSNKILIKEIYSDAKRIEKQTGIKQAVDHIYPLNSDFLCGLHVENNLQIIPNLENCSKSNTQWPGQLPCQTGSGTDHDWWRELNDRAQSPSTSGGRSL